MPRTVLPVLTITCCYTLIGVAFGIAFPLAALAIDFVMGTHGATYSEILQNNPIHYIIHLAPLVLGATFHMMGLSAEKTRDQLEQLVEADSQIRYTAYHDSLTGLENRRAFTEKMADELERIRRQGGETALVLFDIDKFKFINDTLGHNTGDELIREIVIRSSRFLPDEVDLFRLGGDEFVALWPHSPIDKALLGKVRNLVEACADPFDLSDATVSVGISVGVSWLSVDDVSETQALGRADLALYHAKNNNGSTYAVFDPAMAESAANRLKIQRELKQALSDDQLFLTYQPIMDVSDMVVTGFEALIRWQHPLHGLIMPDVFIDAAEQSGLIVPIGRHVLFRACQEAMKWPDDISVSVNLSPTQIRDRGLVEAVRMDLERTGLPARRLILEVTESIFRIDPTLVQEILAGLRELGVRIALDDFGTGFSGINHLRHFTIDILKIDRQYSQAMVGDDRERMLVQTIAVLSKALDLKLTFEGIETREQLEAASALGASSIQGYYISRPLLVDSVLDFIADHKMKSDLAMVS